MNKQWVVIESSSLGVTVHGIFASALLAIEWARQEQIQFWLVRDINLV